MVSLEIWGLPRLPSLQEKVPGSGDRGRLISIYLESCSDIHHIDNFSHWHDRPNWRRAMGWIAWSANLLSGLYSYHRPDCFFNGGGWWLQFGCHWPDLFLFLLGMQPAENTLVAKFTTRRFHHSAFGSKFVLTFGDGFIAVIIVALIEDKSGIESVLFFLEFVSLIWV